MHTAGETTQTMTALLTAAGVATQRSGSEIGRAMRTITLRLQQTRQAFDGLDFDIDGEIVNAAELSNAARSLERLGFEVIRVNNGIEEFATVSEVAEFLADAFQRGTISATELRQVLDALAGQRQSEALLAVIMNWEEYMRVMESYSQGAGSAMQEAMRFADSWEGRLNGLRNAITELIASAVDVGGVARGFIGFATGVINVLTNLTSLLSTVPGQFIAITVAVGLLGKGLITPALNAMAIAIAKVVTGKNNWTAASAKLIVANEGLRKSAKSLGIALKAKFGVIGLISLAVGAAIAGFTLWNQQQTISAERADASARAYRDATNALEEQIRAVENLYNRRDDTRDLSERAEINAEILEIQQQIRDTIGAQAIGLDLVGENSERNLRIMREYLLVRRQAELMDARAAIAIGRANPRTFNNTSTMSDRAQRQLIRSGISSVGGLEAAHGLDIREALHGLDTQGQIAVLREWLPLLSDATLANQDVGDALAFVRERLAYLNASYQENVDFWDGLHEARASAAMSVFELEAELYMPGFFDQLFDPDHAELSATEFRNAIINTLSSLPDEILHLLRYSVDEWTWDGIAITLGVDIDVQNLQQNLTTALNNIQIHPVELDLFVATSQAIEDLVNDLSRHDAQFVLNLDTENLARFSELLAEVAAEGGTTADAVGRLRAEINAAARDRSFHASLEALTSRIDLLNRAMDEQRTHGRLSIETYDEIVRSIDGYSNLLTIVNGQLMLVTDAVAEYSNSLVEAAIHQGVLAGYTYEQIARFAELYIALNEVTTTVESLSNAYSVLTGAYDEFLQYGNLTIGTVMRLLDLNAEYLSVLEFVDGAIRINVQALDEKVNVLRQNLIATETAALGERLLQIAIQDSNRTLREAQAEAQNTTSRYYELGNQALAVAHAHGIAAEAVNLFNQTLGDGEGGYFDLSDEAIEAIQNAIDETTQRIHLLQNMASGASNNFPRGSVPSRSASQAAGRTVDPFYAEIEAAALLEQRLTRIGELLSRNNGLMSEPIERDRQAELMEERISLLREQQGILHEINNINRGAMLESIDTFAQHGIRVSFVPELNKLEFEQTVDEIQSIINNVRIGNQEETNAARQGLLDMFNTIVRMNEVNDRNSSQWHDIRRTISQINLELMNLDFAGFLEGATNELNKLNVELRLIADNDFDRRIELATRQLEVQRSVVAQHNQQLSVLQIALLDGRISSDQFRVSTEEVTRSMLDATVAARQYTEAIAQIELAQMGAQRDALIQQRDATMEIVNMTMRMIQQEARNQIDGLNQLLQGVRDSQAALRDIERDLNNSVRERNALINEQIRGLNDSLRIERERIREVQAGLNEELRIQRELARDRQRQLQNELRAFRDLIQARRRELNRQAEERRFGQDLSDRQTEVQRIQRRLDELANNDSLAARAERARLQEELAQRQRDLDNLVFDNDIRNQQQALDNELDRFQRANQAEQDAIAEALRAFEDAHRIRLALIDREMQERQRATEAEIENLRKQGEAFEAMVAAQIEQLHMRSEMYEREAERILADIDRIQDSIARNGDLVRKAMRRIEQEGENLYMQLIA